MVLFSRPNTEYARSMQVYVRLPAYSDIQHLRTPTYSAILVDMNEKKEEPPRRRKRPGRPQGKQMFREAFEFVLSSNGILKKDFCADSGVSPGMLTDLLAYRACASEETVEKTCSSLGVSRSLLFPEMSDQPWVGPIIDRGAARRSRKQQTA